MRAPTSRLVVALVVFCVGAAPPPAPAGAAQGVRGAIGCQVSRLAGDTAADTAVAVSARLRDRGGEVMITRQDEYADALAAIPLATQRDAPVLFTDSYFLPGSTLEEIRRLGASRATILGGPAAVSPSVAGALEQEGLTVQRIFGPTRWDTAAAVAAQLEGPITELVVVEGDHAEAQRGWPDAVSGGPLASSLGAPVGLVLRDEIPGPTAQMIADLQPDRITVVGGSASVSPEVLAVLSDPDGDGTWERPVRRLSGSQRLLTATEAAWAQIRAVGMPAELWLAAGSTFAEALTASSAAAIRGGVLVLVDDNHDLAGQAAATLRRDISASLAGVALVGDEALLGPDTFAAAQAWMCSGDVPAPDLAVDGLTCAGGGLANHVRVRPSPELAAAADTADAQSGSTEHALALMRAAGPFTAYFDRQSTLREDFAGWIDRGTGYLTAYHETAHGWQFGGSPDVFAGLTCLAMDSQQRGVVGHPLPDGNPPPDAIGERLRQRAAAHFPDGSFQRGAIDANVDIYLSADSPASSHESAAYLLAEFHAYVLGYELEDAIANSRPGAGDGFAFISMDGGWAIIPGTALYLQHLRSASPSGYEDFVRVNGGALAELYQLWERHYPGDRAGFTVEERRALWDFAHADGLAEEIAMATSGRAGTMVPPRP